MAIMIVSFYSCKKAPMYLYVDTMSDRSTIIEVDNEDDNSAYEKAFENYSNIRFYPIFSEFEKTKRYMIENADQEEACESDEGMAAPPDDSQGGSVISTADDVNSMDAMGDEPVYEELSKFNTPSFTLYKLTDGDACKAAQDFVDKKITFEEFEKKVQGNAQTINLYEKNFDKCVAIDRKVFDNMFDKFKKTIAQIEKEADKDKE